MVLEICSGQNSSMFILYSGQNMLRTKFKYVYFILRTKFKYENKRRALTQKISKQELQFMCTALPLMRSIHPQNFITIASTLLEICAGQNSSMKINKGQ